MRHDCLRNPFVPLLLGIPSIHSLPEAWGSWEPQYAPPALHYACIMPIPLLQLQEKPVLCREAEGLVMELWFPRFVTIQWLCSQLCYLTAANQWTIFEIELLATVGWKWGCQPFSCPRLQSVTQCQTRFVGHVCFRNPFPPFLFGIPSVHSLPEAWTPALHYGCIMPVPSLHLQKKTVSCREAEGLVTELWFPRFVTMQWLCSQLRYETAANQPTLVEIEFLASGATSLSVADVRKLWLTAERRFVRHVCCIMASCPSLCCSCRKSMSYAEKQRVWSRSCGLQDLLQCSDCALSCAMWLLQTNEQLLGLSF